MSDQATGGTDEGAPAILGILNITEDSFSDGGWYLEAPAAIAHADRLLDGGAHVVDLGPAASSVGSTPVGVEEEIRRLDPVITALRRRGARISVDSCLPGTQSYAVRRGVDYLNDIRGFPDPGFYPELAASPCRLIVMQSVEGTQTANRVDVPEAGIWDRIERFFEARLEALERAGVHRSRLVLDPGMGFFLGGRPRASLVVLADLGRLRRRFGLPVLVSVSRKSFLRATVGRDATEDLGPATLAAELHAAAAGADCIRTHDPRALRDGLRVVRALRAAAGIDPAASPRRREVHRRRPTSARHHPD